MIMGNTIRLANKYFKNSYWIDNKDGFKIVNPATLNDVNLYCKIKNKKIVGAIEVEECRVTGHEKILFAYGNYKQIISYFNLPF